MAASGAKEPAHPPAAGGQVLEDCLPAACTGIRQEQAPVLQGQDLSRPSPGWVVGILLLQSLHPPSAGNSFPSSLSKTLPCLRART